VSIGSFLISVASSGAVAAAINQGIQYWRDRKSQKEVAKLSALHLASVLEKFRDACSDRLAEKKGFRESDGHEGTDWGTFPELPVYPAEIDWKRIGIIYAETCFDYRSDLNSIQSSILQHYDYDPPDGGDKILIRELVNKGLTAHSLANELRQKFGLRIVIENDEWSKTSYLQKTKLELDEFEEYLTEKRSAQELPGDGF